MVASSRIPRRQALACLGLLVGALAVLLPGVQFVRGSFNPSRMVDGHVASQRGLPRMLTLPAAPVRVNDESAVVAASVVGGLFGTLMGGLFLGSVFFALTSYLARGKDEVAAALQDVGVRGLEAVNYAYYINNEYDVSSMVGTTLATALDRAADSAQANPVAAQAVAAMTGLLSEAGDVVRSFDQDVGIKSTVSSLATTSSEVAGQIVASVIQFAEERGVTDHLKVTLRDFNTSK